MCGIAGIVGPDLSPQERENALGRMREKLTHRGPDASGSCEVEEMAFAHTRLSIIDPDERSNQPMHWKGRWTIVFNGEIYNYRQLRKELQAGGEAFRTQSDTEVLLALYERFGSACVEKLRGMFAFAIWDNEKRSLFLARDLFGIKPLYYSRLKNGLIFASEVKAILASGVTEQKVSSSGLASFLTWGSVSPEEPLLDNIRAVRGTVGWVEGRISEDDHDKAKILPAKKTEASVAEGFREAFLDSVQAHLVSDVDVGIFLSSGIDSSAVLSAASSLGASVTALTLSFPGADCDESADARSLAQSFGVRHAVERVEDLGVLPGLFDDFLGAQDLPSIDGFNTYLVSILAKRQRLKVVLSGLGGDELLGSYPSFARIPKMMFLHRMLNGLPGGLTMAGSAASCWKDVRGPRLAQFFASEGGLADAYLAGRSIYSKTSVRHFLNVGGYAEAVGNPGRRAGEFRRLWAADKTSLEAVSLMEAFCYMRNQLLRDADDNSMKHGVEVRVPFVDVPLWSFAHGLAEGERYQSGKRILEKALPELPDSIFRRRKKGFRLPYEDWLKADLREQWMEIPALFRKQARTWYQKMALLTLSRWEQDTAIRLLS